MYPELVSVLVEFALELIEGEQPRVSKMERISHLLHEHLFEYSSLHILKLSSDKLHRKLDKAEKSDKTERDRSDSTHSRTDRSDSRVDKSDSTHSRTERSDSRADSSDSTHSRSDSRMERSDSRADRHDKSEKLEKKMNDTSKDVMNDAESVESEDTETEDEGIAGKRIEWKELRIGMSLTVSRRENVNHKYKSDWVPAMDKVSTSHCVAMVTVAINRASGEWAP
jgi:hypothetical protein